MSSAKAIVRGIQYNSFASHATRWNRTKKVSEDEPYTASDNCTNVPESAPFVARAAGSGKHLRGTPIQFQRYRF